MIDFSEAAPPPAWKRSLAALDQPVCGQLTPEQKAGA
jgi:hypothetical protein